MIPYFTALFHTGGVFDKLDLGRSVHPSGWLAGCAKFMRRAHGPLFTHFFSLQLIRPWVIPFITSKGLIRAYYHLTIQVLAAKGKISCYKAFTVAAH
jgi:hypothetical protein